MKRAALSTLACLALGLFSAGCEPTDEPTPQAEHEAQAPGPDELLLPSIDDQIFPAGTGTAIPRLGRFNVGALAADVIGNAELSSACKPRLDSLACVFVDHDGIEYRFLGPQVATISLPSNTPSAAVAKLPFGITFGDSAETLRQKATAVVGGSLEEVATEDGGTELWWSLTYEDAEYNEAFIVKLRLTDGDLSTVIYDIPPI